MSITFAPPTHAADPQSGVRSVSVLGDVLTVGGGAGTLSFFDLRAARFIPLESAQAPGPARPGTNRPDPARPSPARPCPALPG